MKVTARILGASMTAALLTAATPAWSINKCVGPDGKVSFQEQPCPGKGGAIEVKPASGMAPAPAPASASTPDTPAAPAAVTPATKKEGVFGETYRRKLDLETHLISSTRAELNGHLQNCDAQQRALAAKKGQARNNLAGATWEQSISAEMQAVAATCDTRARDLRSRLDGFERELRDLKAAK